MTLTLIAGHYKILKASPDGDSIRFYPNDLQVLKATTQKARPNYAGGVQLRLDGIDALETHYQPKFSSLGKLHQPLPLAHQAANELLNFLGFDRVERSKSEIVTAAVPEEIPGFILTKFADTYGRCIAFAFAGALPQPDGSELYLDKALLKKSVNYHLLKKGLVYPTFYSKLYPDLRSEMTLAVQEARRAKQGLWSKDVTTSGFVLQELETLLDEVVIMPKLFRRLVSYLAVNDGSLSLAGFKDYLDSTSDRVIILPDGHITGFDYAVEVNGQQLKLNYFPEQFVFLEK